jgi:sugar/nucleoside kinase (ribokinase family)
MKTVSVIGNLNVDLLVSPVRELPPPGTDLPVENMEVRAAGAAGNTALTLAALGGPPRMVGCVGDDRFGRFLLDEFLAAGIDGAVSVLPGEATGISIAFEAPGRDRSFLSLLGSLESFEASMVPEDALTRDLVLLCGYFCLPLLRGGGALQLLGEARAAGALTLLDTGWDSGGWTDETRAEIKRLLPLVDVFLPNETEAEHLTGLGEPEEAALALQQLSGGWVVTKLGPRGCVAVGPNELRHALAPFVRAVDTTGAGDAFNGGLLHALSGSTEWGEALVHAARVASTVVSRPSEDRYPSIGELVPLPEATIHDAPPRTYP